jgi:hypothetical protein
MLIAHLIDRPNGVTMSKERSTRRLVGFVPTAVRKGER